MFTVAETGINRASFSKLPERGRKRPTFSLVGGPVFTCQWSPGRAVVWPGLRGLSSRAGFPLRVSAESGSSGEEARGGKGHPPGGRPRAKAGLPSLPRAGRLCSRRSPHVSGRPGLSSRAVRGEERNRSPRQDGVGSPSFYHLRRPFLVTLLLSPGLGFTWLGIPGHFLT